MFPFHLTATTSEAGEATQETLDHIVSFFSKEDFISALKTLFPVLLKCALILIVGIVLAKIVLRLTEKALQRSKIDVSLHVFLKSLLKILLYTIVFIIAADALGIPVGTFVAALGVVGLAVSLAVKDSLANLAGGIIILFSRPFVLGDYIETEGVAGNVSEIGLFYVKLNTPDNKGIYVPNGQMSNAKIINYSAEPNRRLDLKFSVGYGEDIQKVKDLLHKIVVQHSLILEEPAPVIGVCALAESSVDFDVKVWVKFDDYWTLYYELYEEVKNAFDQNGVNIPFPQLDLHVVDLPGQPPKPPVQAV
ncbi:MAG: mechanosensitive ion channel family protein [Oscillospiraceae bacterium]